MPVSSRQVEVHWKDGNFTGVRIEVDRGNGQWKFLAVDTELHYLDIPIPGRHHRGIPRHIPPRRPHVQIMERCRNNRGDSLTKPVRT